MRRQSRTARWRGGGLAALLAVLALLLSWLPPMWVPTAAAVPAGSEYPANWSISGNTATGTTPSGVVVTATVAGAVNPPTQGDIIFSGTRPAYLPSGTSALSLGIQNCTNTASNGCGSITYTFSQPVKAPIFYVGAVGAYTTLSSSVSSYHDHPITLASGTFSLDSAGSQSPRMGISNGSRTVGVVNPQQYVGGAPGDGSSCGTFGCGAYDIATATPTITSLTLYYGYEGSGNNVDGFNQILGITPAKSSLSLTKSASPSQISKAGDTVTYSYQVTNTGDVDVSNPRVTESSFSGTGTKPSVSCPTGTLAVGASVTCTVTYTATQADVDAGRVTNTATATATPPSGMTAPTSNSSTATVTVAQRPALTVQKTVAETGDLNAGQTLHYSFKVTNTGNVTLSSTRINETAFTGSGGTPTVSCPNVQLAPGTSLTCTATYTVTQADVDAGTISNTATATGTPPNNGTPVTSTPSTVVVPFTAKPALTVAKSADKQNVVVGDVITYSYKVTNTGNVTMRNVSVAEGTFSGSGTRPAPSCPGAAGSLAPGASVTCTATYTVTQADVDAGKIDNAATATGTPPTGGTPVSSPPGTTTVTTSQKPALTVVKSADRTDLMAGQAVTYSFRATNTGNVTLTNVTVKEGAFSGTGTMSAVSCPAAASSLAPGASVTCTTTYTVTQADVDAGKLTNAATATGVPPGTTTPVESPSSPNTITGTQEPALTVAKSADRTDLVAGQTVTYSYRATNTGNVTLTNLVVDESGFSGSGTLSAITCPSNWLAPGASVTCTATYTVTQADVDAGKLTNSATVSGTPPNTSTPITSPPGTTTVTGTQKPALTVVKSADRTDLVLGQTVTYSFKVTNTGNVTMKNIDVKDSDFTGSGTLSAISCPATTLAPNASTTCMATYTVTQADVDAGTISNSATARGTPPNSTTPVDSPPSTTTVPGTRTPALKVEKSADRTDLVVGQTATYSFKVTNTGNVTLKNVAVQEGSFSGTGSMSAISCPAGASSLAPGAAVTCTATYVVTQADVDSGKLTNTATANGVPPGTNTPVTSPPSDPTTITGTQKPGLTTTKAADKTSVVLGDVITYTFTVTNTGNVTLSNVSVDEGEFSGTGTMSDPVCSAGAKSLAPGASTTCTATYSVTQADVDAGKVTNSATSKGVPPGTTTPVISPPGTTTVTVDQKPALKLEKSADRTDLVAGQTVTYAFKVTNTGNVTMQDVSVKEGDFSGTGTMSAITCPGGSLAPGAVVTCTATYVVTQADVDAGKVTNSATPTGTPPGSTTPQDYPPGTTTLTGTQTPALTVVKTADRTDLVLGQTVTYSFKATNTGNVTLKDVTIKEGDFSGTGTLSAIVCADGAKALAPGASVTCTATYSVTQADVDAGKITNSATTTGVPPQGDTPVTSPPGTTTVNVEQKPGLKVEKSADRTDLVVGQTVTYSFKVTNTGNVTLKDVAVQEGSFSGTGTMSAITCPDAAKSLAPGASVTCTATYVVTQADVDAGKVTNTATGTGVPPNTTTPVTSPPSDPNTITGTQTPGLKVEKSADKAELVVGETITFSFEATNTGNVTLANVTVVEGEFNGTGTLSEPSCPDGAKSLAPGASVTCTATYVVTQADVDTGQLANSATVSGEPPLGGDPVTSPPDTTKVPTDAKPGLKVVKSADKNELVAGETITYSFVVTNTGNVSMNQIAVQEGEFTGAGQLSEVSCPDAAKSLAPGASVTCTATYAVTQDDVDTGKISNSATATGIPPVGPNTPVTSPPGTTTVPADPEPGLSVEKSASPDRAVKAGETITYSFLLANTGNVTLSDVRPVETEFTGTGKLSPINCPDGAAKLIPGQRVTCTATYEVTEADAKSGKLSNAATGTARVPGGGTPPTPPTSTVTVTTVPPAKPELPETGDEFNPLLIGLAVSLAAAGGGLLLAVRRRRGE
ncbi:beta strand repeat-containing protein [Streptomyces niveiscabiei]|uniref:beta strand repeat-containing protein n=1 Tax=Streptomyces TaxID=1883 RepID=UPI0006EB8C6B|nr:MULTISPECIES: LPXTG cell wall anchor domain-containing protein [Streptomyces]